MQDSIDESPDMSINETNYVKGKISQASYFDDSYISLQRDLFAILINLDKNDMKQCYQNHLLELTLEMQLPMIHYKDSEATTRMWLCFIQNEEGSFMWSFNPDRDTHGPDIMKVSDKQDYDLVSFIRDFKKYRIKFNNVSSILTVEVLCKISIPQCIEQTMRHLNELSSEAHRLKLLAEAYLDAEYNMAFTFISDAKALDEKVKAPFLKTINPTHAKIIDDFIVTEEETN